MSQRPAAATRPRHRPAVAYDDQTRPRGSGASPRLVEVRRARRVLRRIDIRSLARFAISLYACGLVVFTAASIGLWLVAWVSGAIPNIQNFITQLFVLKHFHFNPLVIGAVTLAVGVLGVLAATLFTVLTAILYNLIADVIGGVEITVLEEEPLGVTSLAGPEQP